MKRYFKFWYLMTVNSFSSNLISRFGGLLFIIGKLLRFLSFLIFLLLITTKTQKLAGYSVYQVVFFFLSYNMIDTISQLFFREVYRFRQQVVSGNLDLVLTKPISPLFRSLLGGADPFDLIMLIPFGIASVIIASYLHPTLQDFLSYFFLFISGLGIAAAFHIFVLALGILTTEIDHAVMIYRDVVSTGRVPIDIYREPIRGFLTFIIPVGIMMTLPAKAMMGLVTPAGILTALSISLIFILLSLAFWRFALTRYSSASS